MTAAALAVCVVLFPHGEVPSFGISPQFDTAGYHYHQEWEGWHTFYSYAVVVTMCLCLLAENQQLSNNNTVQGIAAVGTSVVPVVLLQLPAVGTYLVHSTEYSNTTTPAVGLWLVVVFSHVCLF